MEKDNYELKKATLVQGFFSLRSSQKHQIMSELGLITDDVLTLPENDRYCKLLIKARGVGKLNDIIDKINLFQEEQK